MGKLTVLFILVAFLVAMLVVGIKYGTSCPSTVSSCPGPSVSPGHYTELNPEHGVVHVDL